MKTGDSISKRFDIAEDIDIGGNVAREIVCGIVAPPQELPVEMSPKLC